MLHLTRTTKEFIYFGDANSSIDFLAFGSTYEEDIDLKVFVYVLRAGAGDSVASTTESRALALANEVIDQLSDDSTINGAVVVSRMRNMTMRTLFLMREEFVLLKWILKQRRNIGVIICQK